MKKALWFSTVFTALLLALPALNSFAQLVINGPLTAQPGSLITLQDADYINNSGAVTNGGIVRFSGTQNTFITAGAAIGFAHLIIDKTSGAKISLNTDITVSDKVQFVNGLLDLNNQTLQLYNPAYLQDESESSRITGTTGGYVITDVTLNAPAAVNPGNLGATITSSQNLGSVTIYREHRSQTNGFGGGNSIYRSYDISPSNNTSLNATLRFQYFDAELNGLDENTLVTWKSANSTTWTNMGFTSRSTTANYVEKTGLSDFSIWTLSSPLNALPLQWGNIEVFCSNSVPKIHFQTLQEQNTFQFIIQQSMDGVQWKNIGILPAAGLSTSAKEYSYTIPHQQNGSYFRILQQDNDRQFSYSRIVKNSCVVTGSAITHIYPNPANNFIQLEINNTSLLHTTAYLLNGRGQLLQSIVIKNNTEKLNTHTLPAGIYVIQLANGECLKFIKQ